MKWLWFLLSFKGRIARRPYWIFMLLILSVFFSLAVTARLGGTFDTELWGGVFISLVAWSILAVHAKRWHDRDRSGWWLPLAAILVVGQLWVIIECVFLRGTPGDNRFGPAPVKTFGSEGKTDRYQPALICLLLVMILASGLNSYYRVPSGSMMPTLLVGDFFVGNRFAYGIPMPFSRLEVIPLSGPARGDVIVHRHPADPTQTYITRVVGEPGDRIYYSEKQIYINGEPLLQTDVGVYHPVGSGMRARGAVRRIERTGVAEHAILVHPERADYSSDCKEMEGYEVPIPEAHYFVMGDNRDDSNDSRCWGFVPRDHLVGKAFMIWFHWDWKRPGFTEWERVGNFL